ncbi:putative barnase/colicin E5 family endoribonuclease [Helicobacter baculiformis]|nr:hypothetical protein [Helicobacter baculiformis]
MGYIDLVWGNLKGEGRGAKGWGLSKIFAKHLEDFKGFEGSTPLQKLARGLEEIVSGGEVLENAGVYTIHLKNQNGSFRVGLSRGWNEQGNNHWVITAYKDGDGVKPPRTDSRPRYDPKGAEYGTDLTQRGKVNSTTSPLKGQEF